MPIGYLVTVAFVALLTVFAFAPIRRPRSLALLSWGLSLVINELPFLAFYWLLAATLLAFGQGDIDSAGGWVMFSLAVRRQSVWESLHGADGVRGQRWHRP